jgi:hypothetical protein
MAVPEGCSVKVELYKPFHLMDEKERASVMQFFWYHLPKGIMKYGSDAHTFTYGMITVEPS